jgi:hypothetical protein
VSSLAPNASQIWGRFGEKLAIQGVRLQVRGQRWMYFSAQRYPSGQKGTDGEDLGPTLEMLSTVCESVEVR